jgi:hypothetical protein
MKKLKSSRVSLRFDRPTQKYMVVRCGFVLGEYKDGRKANAGYRRWKQWVKDCLSATKQAVKCGQ